MHCTIFQNTGLFINISREILQSHTNPELMIATLHYVREAINKAAQFVFIVVLNLDTAEMTASTVINLDKNVIKKEH